MYEPSGRQWCVRFPSSASVDDLVPEFGRRVKTFLARVAAAGAAVSIADTYRPPERAYLMHWCCMIAQGGQDPAAVPAMSGVLIDWTCGGNRAKAKTAALDMMRGYNIAFPAALVSRHTQRRAIDMTIRWAGTIHVTDARGIVHAVTRQEDLWPIGTIDGVKKLATDPPHWSDDGH